MKIKQCNTQKNERKNLTAQAMLVHRRQCMLALYIYKTQNPETTFNLLI